MFGTANRRIAELEAVLSAIDKSRARIEFAMDGTILDANQAFLNAVGYSLSEIKNKHHSMLMPPAMRDSATYREFWAALRRGEFQSGQFKRIAKDGRDVWLEASYDPIIGKDGKPYKVVKFATDITREKLQSIEAQGKIAAIGKSQAVIEFAMDGTILHANQNFLDAMGYSLAEVQGRHHSMFVEAADRDGPSYAEFWAKLRRGEYQAAQYKRIGKGGRVVWIEASYNPILDPEGKPFKVVKFATDISAQIARLADLKKLIDVNFSEIDDAVHQSDSQAHNARQAATETSSNVQMVASSAEELAASIREISESMTKSQAATDGAAFQVSAASEATRRLSEATTAMGGIVGLIQNIAGQINLLALNATIESARAGEAGKGFAVVANEVKHLANQAAKATGQISTEIEGLQAISADVVKALDVISGSMNEVQNYVATTASAVEEQSAVTREMSLNMNNAASAVETITSNISGIATAILQAGSAVSKTKEAAMVLAR